MKNKIVLCLIVYMCGIGLTLVFLTPFKNGPGINKLAGLMGVSVSFISVIYGLIIMNSNTKEGYDRISSLLTPL